MADPSHISPMPLRLTLGITVWLLRLGIEIAYYFGGMERADVFSSDLARVLRQGAGVKPVSHFGGMFEGRQCQRIGRHLSLVCELLAAAAPESASFGYTAACGTWRELLSVLKSVGTCSKDDVSSFRRRTALLLDDLMAEFEWVSVTPKLHKLVCHAPDFLAQFGSLGGLSEQGPGAWHEHYDLYASQYAADTFFDSCLDYVRRAAVSRAPGDVAQNRGKLRKPALPNARCATRPDDKRTRAGKILAGEARLVSDSCAWKEADDVVKWARDNLAVAVRRVDSYIRGLPSGAVPVPDLESACSLAEDHHEELMEAETACLVRFLDY